MPVIHVKSMPGTLVAMPPILIGSPDAASPVPSPQSPEAWMLLGSTAPPPPSVVVAPPAAVVVAPPAVVVAAAAVVVAPAAVVVAPPLSSSSSPPQAASTSAPAAAMAKSERLMCVLPSTGTSSRCGGCHAAIPARPGPPHAAPVRPWRAQRTTLSRSRARVSTSLRRTCDLCAYRTPFVRRWRTLGLVERGPRRTLDTGGDAVRTRPSGGGG